MGFLLLVGCQREVLARGALPFETVENKEVSGTGRFFEAREPTLIVIGQSAEIANLDGLITEKAKSELANMNYDRFFALLVFQGKKQSNQYSLEIRGILQSGSDINVNVDMKEPMPNAPVGMTITSPYHLVKVEKGGLRNQYLTFNLMTQGTNLIQVRYHIP